MEPVRRDDPHVTAAARQLGITMIMRAYVEDRVLYIVTPYTVCEVPAPPGYGQTNTLPRGLTEPAQHSTGASVPPQASDPPSADAGPEAPPKPNATPTEVEGSGLDDFTAINGVGPKYAQALHNAGFYTYDDLREWQETLEEHVPASTAKSIRFWLKKHLM